MSNSLRRIRIEAAHSVEPNAFELNDSPRLTALSRSGLMDSLPEPVFDRLTELAARLLTARTSLVSFVDDNRQFFKSACGLNGPFASARETPLTHSFCQLVVKKAEPLIVSDARRDSRVRNNLAIRDLGVIAYLGVQLVTPDGLPLGSFCVIDDRPRDWTKDDLRLISDLASAVQSEIGLRLAVAEADVAAQERDLLMEELNHRVKNLFAMVSSMVGLTARSSDNVAHMAESLRGRIHALADAHALVQPAITGVNETDSGSDLYTTVETILAPHMSSGKRSIDGAEFQLNSQSGAHLSLVLHELATNAAKYGALSTSEGHVSVCWTLTQEHISISWLETNPNLTVKPPEEADKGFGSRLIASSVRLQMGGTLSRNWRPDGLSATLVLPRRTVEQPNI